MYLLVTVIVDVYFKTYFWVFNFPMLFTTYVFNRVNAIVQYIPLHKILNTLYDFKHH